MRERISVTPKILEINDTNEIYMEMDVRILSATPNLNLAEFTEDFITSTVENKDEFIGIPFVVDKEPLENGEYDNLTHRLESNGELKTDQIGSFVDFWSDIDDEDIMFLAGRIRIMKRFQKTCEAITELYEEGNLNTSCEVLVSQYEEVSDEGIRRIHYNEGKNKLFASCLVTNPADTKAKASLLVAEAYQEDVQRNQGGDSVGKKDKIEVFNKGIETKFVGQLETSSMTWSDVQNKIYNLLNPVDTENGGRDYNYYIYEVYTDSVIVGDWDSGDLYRISHTIEGESVTLAPEEDWVKGSFQFVPEGVTVNELIVNNEKEVAELQKKLDKLKEEEEKMAKEVKETAEKLQEKIDELTKENKELAEQVEQLKGTIVDQETAANETKETIEELNSTIEDLEKYKEQVETAEKEAAVAELTAKYSKLLDEKTFESDEVQTAINELDEASLNSIVVAEIAKRAVETAEAKSDEVVLPAQKQKTLVNTDKDASYWSSPAK